MSLLVTNQTLGDERSVTVVGEVDVSNANELRSALDEALASNATAIRVDLGQVPYIDSTGIGVLVGAARRAEEANATLVVCNPQRNVARVLSLLGVGEELGVDL